MLYNNCRTYINVILNIFFIMYYNILKKMFFFPILTNLYIGEYPLK